MSFFTDVSTSSFEKSVYFSQISKRNLCCSNESSFICNSLLGYVSPLRASKTTEVLPCKNFFFSSFIRLINKRFETSSFQSSSQKKSEILSNNDDSIF